MTSIRARRIRRRVRRAVAGGALATAVVHGHALVPGVTEWLVAQRSCRPRRRKSGG